MNTFLPLREIVACLLLCLAFLNSAVATDQAVDSIVFEGKEYQLSTGLAGIERQFLMEPYFAKHPSRRPRSESKATALRRGYLATFEIVDAVLMLKDIETVSIEVSSTHDYPKGFRRSHKEVVLAGQVKLKIDWYSGVLTLVSGKLLEEPEWLEPLKYANYTLLEIKKGMLVDHRTFSYEEYEQFKDLQFQLFSKTETYRVEVQQHMQAERDLVNLHGLDIDLEETAMLEGINASIRDRIIDYTKRLALSSEELVTN